MTIFITTIIFKTNNRFMNSILLNRIAKLIVLHGIPLEEVEKEVTKLRTKRQKADDEAHFDLLVELATGKRQRVPFDEYHGKGRVLGIFPFQFSSAYLASEETEETTRRGCRESNIPSIAFWEGLEDIRELLNKELASLNLPIIQGCYFASTPYGGTDLNWIIGFVPKDKRMQSDYYGNNELAKIRYVEMYQ